jgi:hypothetical protein
MKKRNQPIERELYQTTSNENVKGHHSEKYIRPGICIRDYSPTEYEELAFMQPSDYQLIFGIKDSEGKRRGSQIVKITNPNNGRSIHRQYRTSYEIHGLHNYVSITFTAIKEIVNSKEEFDNLRYVQVSKGSRICYYITHPNYAVRISIYLGSISVILGILSFLISLLCLFI